MEKLLYKIECADLYTLYWFDGKIHIRILGYYYDAGFAQEDDGKDWRYVAYSGYDMPLADYLASTEQDRAGWEEMYTRWIEDISAESLFEYLTCEDAPTPLHISEITEEDVNDKIYIDVIL